MTLTFLAPPTPPFIFTFLGNKIAAKLLNMYKVMMVIV